MGKSIIDCARAHRCNFLSPVCRGYLPDRRFHIEVCAPRAVASEIQTRSTIAQAYLRSSTFPSQTFGRSAFASPTVCARTRQPNLIKNTPDDCVHDCG